MTSTTSPNPVPVIGRHLTLEHIKKFPEKLNRFQSVCIWSGQWRAWWRKGGGYTEFIETAEIFDIKSAFKQTRHCGKEKKISYHECKSLPNNSKEQ